MSFLITTDKETKKAYVQVTKLVKNIELAMQESFIELGSNLVREGENLTLNEPKQGRWYPAQKGDTVKVGARSSGSGVKRIKQDSNDSVKRASSKRHRASAPGQSPALLSGNYHDKFGYKISGKKQLVFGNEADYAGYLEDGTDIMEPRPGVENAAIASIRNARNYFDRSLIGALDLES